MKAQSTFKALGDPTRRLILELLSEQDMTIAEVVNNFDMTRAAVKKHLTILETGGLISVTPSGRERINSLNVNGMRPILDWLGFFDTFWDQKLNNLKTAIERDIQ